jgi:uncharacterized protein
MDTGKMSSIYSHHQKLITELKSEFRRDLIDQIDWNEKMLALKGSRGVGKTTLLLQHIKETFKTDAQALYISMDSIYLAGSSIYDIADYHAKHGGTHLFVDEIHKYANWSIELKNIYDNISTLKVVFSSSSILQIYKGYADLSRRVVDYHLHGLSLREFIQIETKSILPKYTFAEIITNHAAITKHLHQTCRPLTFYKNYLQHGYFPFYLQGKKAYYQKLQNILNITLEVDLPYCLDINIHNVSKLKRLISIIASALPFQPNITKLAESLEITRATVTQYLYYLEQAEIINLLNVFTKTYTKLTKPEKIFLQNTNLAYAIQTSAVNIGTSRELFFFNQLKSTEKVHFAAKGDFLINEKYTFEIGGPTKSFQQIADVADSFLAVDETELGTGNKIPLWLFGFLY